MSDQTVSLKLDVEGTEELKRELSESADTMDELASASTKAGDDIEASVTGATSAWEEHSAVISGAAVAAGAAGAAMEGLARSQQDMRAIAGRLGNTIEGETTDSIMGLAAEVHDATRDLDEMVAMMEIGSQQGLESGKQLQDYAVFWDTVGDATGETAEQLARSSAALRAVGIDAGNEKDALGAFGFVAQETTGSVTDFLKFIDRVGPELREMNADVDDAAAILGVMEHELGMSGRTARQEFRTAIGESDGTLQGLLDTLGIGQDVFADYTAQVDASTGVIADNAAAFKESRTFAQELQADLEALGARFSGVVAAGDAMASGLMVAGGAVFGINQLRGVLGGLQGRISRITPMMLGKAGMAGALIGVAIAADQLGDSLSAAMDDRVEDVEDLRNALVSLGTDLTMTGITDAFGDDLAGLSSDLDRLSKPTKFEKVEDFLAAINPLADAPGAERARERIAALDEALVMMVQSQGPEAAARQLGLLADAAELNGDELTRLQELLPGFNTAIDTTTVTTGEAAEASEDLAVEIDTVKKGFEDTTTSIDDYTSALRAATDPVFALTSAVDKVNEAQSAYNEAVETYGQNSQEAQDASLDLAQALAGAESAALNGDLSFVAFSRKLDDWVRSGDLTAQQAAEIRDRVAEARGEAERFEGEYRAEVGLTIDPEVYARLRELGRMVDEATGRKDVLIEGTTQGGQLAGGAETAVSTVNPNRDQVTRAGGGPVDPSMGAVLVGEQGRELVTFGQQGMVHDAASTAQILNSGRQMFGDVTIMAAPVQDGARDTVWELRGLAREFAA